MIDELKLSPETQDELKALSNFKLEELAGYCPVQARGWISGEFWYFREQGPTWSFEVGGNPTFSEPPAWWHQEQWGADDISAGYMTDEEAVVCILKAIQIYKSTDRIRLRPGDVGYGDHLLNAWSAGMISAAKVGEYLNLNVIQVVELGLAKGLPQPWTTAFEVQRFLQGIVN